MSVAVVRAPVMAQQPERTARRYEPRALPAVTGIRLSGGIDARLINISATGMLVECATRPPSNVRVTFEGDPSLGTVSGRVARTIVAALSGDGPLYHVGIAFAEPIPLQTPPPDLAASDEATAPTTAEPLGPPRPTPRNRW